MNTATQNRSILAAVALAIAAAASAPLAAYAAATKNTTVSALVNSTISMTTSGTVSLTLSPTTSSVVSSASDTVTVNCNSTNGYTLTLADNDAVVNLASGGNTITAHSGTTSTPTALTDGKWGFAKPGAPFDTSYAAENSATSSVTKWAGVPASGSPFTLKNTATVASNDVTTIWYGARVATTQPTGTYTDTVVYTATAK